MSTFNYGAPGLGHVGSYQVSGKPFATGSVTAPASGSIPLKIEFPSVTRWFHVIPHNDSGTKKDLRIGFSEYGVTSGSNYIKLHSRNTDTYPPRFELKVSEVWFMCDSAVTCEFDLIAGLTGISTGSISNNWSGSAGVG